MNVIRKATYHDETTHKQIIDDEVRARKICFERIRGRKLPMKLAEVEYSFDRKKVIFYFTAEDRVDFRELVRDLAQELKARIELRHIQVRDEAKMVGGIGTCGRELCCTSWLREFMPISMKMAKRQNLSLNPAKISGQCGRLMCCLSYENEQYSREKKAHAVLPPNPEHLAVVREQMEDEAPMAAVVLRKTSLGDVIPEKSDWQPEDLGSEIVGTLSDVLGEDDEAPEEAGESETPVTGNQGATADRSTESGRRRRKRRRKRSGGGGGGTGGGQAN